MFPNGTTQVVYQVFNFIKFNDINFYHRGKSESESFWHFVADSHTQFLTGLIGILLTLSSIVLFAGCVCCQRRSGFKVSSQYLVCVCESESR